MLFRSRTLRQSFEFSFGVDRPPLLGQPRAEHEPYVAQLARRAQWARRRCGGGVVATDSQQLQLGIAHLFAIDLAGPHGAKQPSTVESIVDRARMGTRAAMATRLGKLHPARLPTLTDTTTAPNLRTVSSHDAADRRGVPDRAGSIGQSENVAQRPQRRRHPSAGNLNEPPEVVAASVPETSLSTLTYPVGAPFNPTRVRFGPGLADEALDRLIGTPEGKRILELGAGDGSNAIALARRGARVFVVDSSAERLAVARANADTAGVRVEFRHSDLAELADVRADRLDGCLAVYSLARVVDVARVFRQVHRLLRTEAPLVVSLPHPLELLTHDSSPNEGPPTLTRSAFDDSRIFVGPEQIPVEPHHTADIVTALTRSSFHVDAVLEPPMGSADGDVFRAPRHDYIPATAIYRGRKLGT